MWVETPNDFRAVMRQENVLKPPQNPWQRRLLRNCAQVNGDRYTATRQPRSSTRELLSSFFLFLSEANRNLLNSACRLSTRQDCVNGDFSHVHPRLTYSSLLSPTSSHCHSRMSTLPSTYCPYNIFSTITCEDGRQQSHPKLQRRKDSTATLGLSCSCPSVRQRCRILRVSGQCILES